MESKANTKAQTVRTRINSRFRSAQCVTGTIFSLVAITLRKNLMKDVSSSFGEEGFVIIVWLQGHVVKSCPKPSFCKVTGCQSEHSTYLHPRNDTRVAEKSSGPDVPWRSVVQSDNGTTVDNNGAQNSCVNAAKAEFAAIGAGVSVTGLPVVPVKVKFAGSSKVIETYAFLDPGYNTTSCTNELLEQLGVEGKETILSLTTLQKEDQTTRCNFGGTSNCVLNRKIAS